MEQKLNRLLRGCVESGGGNPIASIHDQGAGGNGNVLKELSEPAGAVIYASRFQRGDPTLSVLELWGAEYQESNALLARPAGLGLLRRLAARERCPLSVVGTITGDGRIVLVDDLEAPVPEGGVPRGAPHPRQPGAGVGAGQDAPQGVRAAAGAPHPAPPGAAPGAVGAAGAGAGAAAPGRGQQTLPHQQGGPLGDGAGGPAAVRGPPAHAAGRRGRGGPVPLRHGGGRPPRWGSSPSRASWTRRPAPGWPWPRPSPTSSSPASPTSG
ncbi:phosphoribosylformylglycinamidine synthase [Chroicocephalus ridibundus]|uniref:phosphoribosylformylglycinamidine synthase n=1 Tax=Chroicocephalus ridibundus TaxID=1192867 RepID=UPI002FDEC065